MYRMTLKEFQQLFLADKGSNKYTAPPTVDDYMTPQEWQDMYDGVALASEGETGEQIVQSYASVSYIMSLFLCGVENNQDGNGCGHPIKWSVVNTWEMNEDETLSHFVMHKGAQRSEITLGTGHTFEVIVRQIDRPTDIESE